MTTLLNQHLRAARLALEASEPLPTVVDYDAIAEQRARVLAGRPVDGAVRRFVYASWQRSQELGLDPLTARPRRIGPDALAERLERHRGLIELARPHLEWVSTCMASVDHVLYITDRDGIVLDAVGSDRGAMARLGLEPGYNWSEAAMGTNGAGTALALGHPVAVVGPEHYSELCQSYICTGAPILDADGRVVGAVDLSVGLTAGTESRLAVVSQAAAMIHERLAHLETRDASRAKSEFLANVSHEVRTPMAVIVGYSHLLREELTAEEREEAIEAIERNSTYLLDVLGDILDLSRVEARRLPIERERVDLEEVLSDLYALMGVRATEHGLQLDVEVEGPVPAAIETDPTRLRQVLVNLLSNAVKFTPAGGQVGVRVRVDDADPARPEMVFEVRDTGVGIAPERREAIFEPFVSYPPPASHAVATEGVGLGLAITHRLVEALGGRLELDSQPGRGSCFTVRLELEPLADVGWVDHLQISGTPPRGLPRARRLDGRRVLVAEDRPEVRKLLVRTLERAGCEVVAGANGQEALRLYDADSRFSAVVLDMRMPVLNGYAAAGQLRARGFSGPIIAVTAAALAGDQERCLEAGCSHYLTKPVDLGVLTAILAEAEPVQPRASHDKPRVLVVEDHPMMSRVLEVLLRQHGMVATLVGRAREALEAVVTERFDAVLTDLSLPDGDGESLAHELVARRPDLPVIAYSGRAPRPEARQAFAAVVAKDADATAVVRAIEDALIRQR